MIRLHPDWRLILRRAWCVKPMLVAAVLGGVSAGLAAAQPYLNWNPFIVAFAIGVATTGASLAAIWARVLDQGGLNAL